MIKRLARYLARHLFFRWVPCVTCAGNPQSAASWGDPYGCWDCRNLGREPRLRRPWTRSARTRAWAWRIGPCE